MQKILGYIGLAIMVIAGLHQIMQINNVSDVIAEGNRKSDIEMAAAKAERQADEEDREYDSENFDLLEPSDLKEQETDE